MSKTVEEIGLIVGGIALAAVPGLQMLGVLTIAGHAALLNGMLGIGLTTALSGVGLALRQTPQTVGVANSISFNNGPAPRRIVYGQSQTAGVLTYASFPPSQNQSLNQQFLHLVYTLTSHEISSIDAVVIDGTVYNFGTDIIWDNATNLWHVNPAANPTPIDFYWQHLFFEFDFGSPIRVANPFVELAASDSGWTTAFAQQGCAKVHVVCRFDTAWTALFPSGQIPNIQFLITGKKLMDPRIVTAWQPSTGFLEWNYIVDNNGVIWVQQNSSGTSGIASARPNFEGVSSFPATLSDNTCSWKAFGGTLADAFIANSQNPQGNLENGRLINDGWIQQAGWPQGAITEAPIGYLQQQQTASGPFSGTTPPNWSTTLGGTVSDGGLSWTCIGRSPRAINPSNSALCVYDYLLDTDAGMKVPAATVNLASVIAAANVCEEQELIIWNADDTVVFEDLYSCNGMFDHSSLRGNVLTSLCGSMAGWIVQPGDFWYVFAGAYTAPIMTLTDDDLRGPIKGQFRLSRRDVANSVKGRYIPAYLPVNPGGANSMTQVPGTWQSQSFPAYQANGLAGKPNYLNSEDAGQVIWQELQLDFTTSLWTAQRLAKIALMRLRFPETITLPCKMTAFPLVSGDTFGFTHTRWGMTGSTFVIENDSITFENGKDGSPTVGVDLVARQVDPSIYEFQGPTSSTDFGEYSPYGVTGVMTGVE
jgi:hypothetical protein